MSAILHGDTLQYGRGSLHEASENGHKEVVELLLEKGADVDKADKVAR